ncbi:Signal recognition particle protein [Chlamydia avium]|uniref:signal-recognition-particle GTPase n=1 Tax=Chlamydia avium TaxID=1457141 RepID=A0ABP2X6D4_9CHLA|nr:signal recognition particle protein [Chlamydia avium]EPP37366.1 signal recognition particle protein [Chlamydia psittaci 10_743_SC13]EPP38364.1 signal recognition particle protein [Chlamydia avium]VVT42897.1 Signal recognition particle protein [Chlamydia avium]
MISSLSQKLSSIFSSLVSSRRITEGNISDAIREVRLAMLDADVNYHVVKDFIAKVKKRILGEEVWKHVSPGQQFIQCLHEEIVKLLDGNSGLITSSNPSVILICGLQGTGKTTTCAKLAAYVMRERKAKKVLVVPCDLKRFAAVDQLRSLISLTQADLYSSSSQGPVEVVSQALDYARRSGYDLVLIDTAGRLHVDSCLMQELVSINKVSNSCERLFVMNLAMGQDAVATAKAFDEYLDLTGVIVTMTDGDSRAGAVLSMKNLLGKPIKFEGCGEKIEDLRLFNAESMADRILGMGDTVHFVQKMRECISEEEGEELGKKLVEATFTYEDYYKQMKAFRRMGPLRKIMNMMPSFGGAKPSDKEMEDSEKYMRQTEAIILSMTPQERREEVDLSISRMKRIALGCGLTLGDVNQFRKQMAKSKKFFKNMSKERLEQMRKKMSGGHLWR